MGNPLGNLYGIIKGSWGSANPRIWEKFLHATASHDLDIEAADGRVTAHAQMLMEASPVVQAMLLSPMKERQTKQIKLKDTSSSAVTLFLEVLYTCSSQGDPDYKTALSALDLAHRWQVEVVVEILADFIEGPGFRSWLQPSKQKQFATYSYLVHFGPLELPQNDGFLVLFRAPIWVCLKIIYLIASTD